MTQNIERAAAFIKENVKETPKIGLILGSGLGVLADEIEGAVKLTYENIPDFPVSTVEGHAGQIVMGMLEGVQVIAMQGRFHFYEGYSMDKVTFPVRVMKALGVESLIVTNAAGGINSAFGSGELMIITDHLDFTGANPLIGPNAADFGPRFPDMSEAYDKELVKLAEKTAQELNIPIQKGVYAGVTGPSYETPAEVQFLKIVGADAVGMSTVPEVIVANHAGLRVLGISCISNPAAGIHDQPLSHEEVMEMTEKAKGGFLKLVKAIIARS